MIWYHLYNLRNVKNTHGGVLMLLKLQAKPTTLLKLTILHGCLFMFLKLNKWDQIVQRISHIN